MNLGVGSSVALALLAGACSRHKLRAADPSIGVTLPRDHGAHEDAQTEWWHFHGHLSDDAGRRYDFFVAFVKQHTDVDRLWILPARWLVDPFQLAYFTLADRGAKTFSVREKHAFPDTWAASTTTEGLRLRHDSWSAEAKEDGSFVLRASTRRERLEVRLRPEGPPVLLGDRGLVRIPPRSDHFYYSLPYLSAQGTVAVAGEKRRVQGTAWFKHEWGFLISDHIGGFVWFGAQLSSGQRLEVALLQDRAWNLADGSFAVLEESDGRVVPLELGELGVAESGAVWRSPRTGTVYPIGWIIDIPGRGRLVLEADVPNQEMVVFPANLWAGSLAVSGSIDGQTVTGDCFVEIVGMDPPFGRDLLRSGKPEPRR